MRMKHVVMKAATVVVVICVALLLWGTWGTRTWRNVELDDLSTEWQSHLMIPGGASNITCWMRNGFGGERYFECTLSREQLDAYLEKHDWRLEPIREEFTIRCPFEENRRRIFSIGEYYQEWEEGGGHVVLVYQAENNRLFFDSSVR